MTSQLKSDTARANGAKSKGPKTAETREISSRNSLKHGITTRNNMLLACEDPAEFQQVVDHYTAFYQPANPIETDLVEEIIGAKWRIRRLKIIEVALVDYELDCKKEEIQRKLKQYDNGIHLAISFKGVSDESRAMALLTRYESRLQRIYHRSHQAFLDLRRAIAAGLVGQAPKPPSPEPPPPEPPPTENRQPTTNNQQPLLKFINEPTRTATPTAPPRGNPGPTPDTLRESQPKPL